MLDMFGLQSQPPPSQLQFLPPRRSHMPQSQYSTSSQGTSASVKETVDSLAEDCLNRPVGKSTEDDSSDDEPIVQPVEQETAEAVEVVWLLNHTYANMDECKEAIDEEDCWTKSKTLLTANGIKTGYRCKRVKRRGKQCSAGIYTIHDFDPTSTAVRLYRKNLAHDHGTSENRVTAITKQMKEKIIYMYEQHDKPKSIMYKL